MPTINREHKDRLFSFLFGSEPNREWTLYNVPYKVDTARERDCLKC